MHTFKFWWWTKEEPKGEVKLNFTYTKTNAVTQWLPNASYLWKKENNNIY